ncbi:conserved hypothetical protein [Thioalkalivibrio sulfidiphilus HL-EbGr7]|uniref:Chalcone isomerase domain-containing protein n=1 Tax=Thioalkalivibrio sulfidiphilus (strain HL-EbGR7) TaxID=396588 RepID=B8GR49_THISH|nr:chalcone isomerase family protein [Thioalkalivibrio sulfidiphilus]ACL72469.1 conserved hypothetical protein [Thioalkalivibrio sulfidiphilus HL-EbGr7]
MSSLHTHMRARTLAQPNRSTCTDRMILFVAALLLFLIPTLPAQASVVTVGDARFQTQLKNEAGKNLVLKGTGVARYAVFIRVYGAGLYGPEGVPASSLLERGEPKRLEIEYFVDIKASDLVLAANTILERQLSAEELQALEPRIRQLHDAYRSVRPGDRYVMEYLPDQGTVLRLNGEPLVTVEGRDFARAYFGIWLGDEPLSSNLRNALLGQ